jgi:peptidoglycan/LPS O-acetylase OafA/YrhL
VSLIVVGQNLFGSRLGLGKPVEQSALGPGSIISHVLLVHNATYSWVYRINGPLWSVATEWQIYFLFALVLLPLWRRAGAAVTALAAWVLSSIPFFALPPEINLSWACPWFVGSFALGMAGAVIGFAPGYDGSFLRNRAPWSAMTWLVLAVIVAVVATGRIDTWGLPATDLIVSCLAFCWINSLVQASDRTSSQPGVMLRLLGSRTLVYLGGFSYSLYLVQFPLVRLADRLVTRLPLSRDAILASELLIVTPVILFVAWVFSELFERPFTTGGTLLPALRRRFDPGPADSPSPRLSASG